MRLSPALLLAFVPFCAAPAGPVSDAAIGLKPSTGSEIPFGIEAVTGYRSEYVYRGFKLSHQVLDFQLETEIALSNHWMLAVGGWYATETGSGSFEEATGFVDLRYEQDQWAIGLNTSYHSFSHTIFQDGVDAGLFFTWMPNDDFHLTAGGYYDDGAGAWYGKLEGGWSQATSDSSFVSFLAGTSWLDDYYGRSGWNDAYARLSWTFAISDRIALTPFVGTSLSLDSGGPGSDYVWAGLWFEVNF